MIINSNRKLKISLYLVAIIILGFCLTKIILSYRKNQGELIIKEFSFDCDCKSHLNLIVSKSLSNKSEYNVKLVNKYYGNVIKIYNLTNDEFQNSLFTCNIHKVLARGRDQKVLSFSLFGKDEYYYNRLKRLIYVIKKMYPGWFVRVYHNKSVDKSFVCQVECLKDEHDANYLDLVDFCEINNMRLKFGQEILVDFSYLHSRLWKVLAIGDSFIDLFASRDAHFFIIQREIDSVNAWLNSSMYAHIMRDHLYHFYNIIASMWGLKTGRNRSLSNTIFDMVIDPNVINKYNPYKCIFFFKFNF